MATTHKLYKWTFGDGTTALGSKVKRTYDKPGRYSEILKATDDRGHVAYDFAIVDVVERGRTNKPSPAMHAACFPSLNIRHGVPVTFVVRTAATTPTGETWDFGDGTPPVSVRSDASIGSRGGGYATTVHAFAKPGNYLVRAEHKTEGGVVVTMRLHVPVE